MIENRIPGAPEIVGSKNPAVHLRHIENVWLGRHARDRSGPPAAEWAHISPAQYLRQIRAGERGSSDCKDEEERGSAADFHERTIDEPG